MPDSAMAGRSWIEAAQELLGERLNLGEAVRAHHARGEDSLPPHLPDAVAFPETTEEVSRLAALCHARAVPLTAFSAGTSLEGQVTPVAGGLSVDFSRMDRVLDINAADMDCLVQPGITRRALARHLHGTGLFFPPDPGADCSIGGMCGTRASGTNAIRYGTIRDNVLGLQAVLADGRVIRTGGRVRKQATGYDLTRLLVGSEGTLALFTEIRLRLHPLPEALAACLCQFDTLKGATDTVIETLAAAVPVARIELLDEVQAAACAAYSKLPFLAPLPTLLLEFHGSAASVGEQLATVAGIASDHGGRDFLRASTEEERSELWRARHDAYWAARAIAPDHAAITTDSIVPISRLADAVVASKAAITRAGLHAPIVGHVGDGNFHTVILVPPGPEGLSRAIALDHEIVAIAQSFGGSCSGEHGVGLGKRGFVAAEHGEAALDVMRAIKRSFDPQGILNPGKMFPPPPDARDG